MAPLYTQAMTNGAVRLLHQCTGHRLARVRQEREQLWDRGNGLRTTLARDRREQRYRAGASNREHPGPSGYGPARGGGGPGSRRSVHHGVAEGLGRSAGSRRPRASTTEARTYGSSSAAHVSHNGATGVARWATAQAASRDKRARLISWAAGRQSKPKLRWDRGLPSSASSIAVARGCSRTRLTAAFSAR
jgi:hypothetical protein